MEKEKVYTVCSKLTGNVFVAMRYGACIHLSIPARTPNDFKRDAIFLELPLMSDEAFGDFVNIMIEIKDKFVESK